MLKIENINAVIAKNHDLMTDDCLYVEIEGEIKELCNITFIDGKLVLKPEFQL